MSMRETIGIATVTMGVLVMPAFAQSTTVAGFDGGSNDGFTGNAFFEAADGNPGGNAHHAAQIFFNELRTGAPGEEANPDFLGDYTAYPEVTYSVDVKTESLTDFIGNQIARPIGIRLVNHDIMGTDGPAGVFWEAGILGVNFTPDWTTLSVTVDPNSTELPPGWIGFGDTNKFFEPVLPAGVTFADILANVTEFDVTGAVPGFFFTFAFFDVRIDNIAVTLPEPPPAASACLDIKPGSCPNSVNLRSGGNIPVALVGSMDFDVLDVDLSSLTLSRADGVGGRIMPLEGPPGPQTTVEDVATPTCGDDDGCACTTDGADGIDDLMMYFSTRHAAAAFELWGMPGGSLVELCLSGTLIDGTAFVACDCIRLVPVGGQMGTGN